MSDDPIIDPVDGVQLLRSYLLHCRHVRHSIGKIADALTERAETHDISKLMPDEFGGFSRINKAAREHPYGSEEYTDGLRREKPTVDLHYSRNDHHPEQHGSLLDTAVCFGLRLAAQDMGFLAIIEMVCDWHAAFLAYGSQGTWAENIERQKERFKDHLAENQWWLVEQVSAFIAKEQP